VLVHLRRWQFQDLLVRPARELAASGSGRTLSFAAAFGLRRADRQPDRRSGARSVTTAGGMFRIRTSTYPGSGKEQGPELAGRTRSASK
jgi:hypothetical protein